MKFDRIVESAIREAMARGEFENLPGKGKPVDLTEYFNAPEDIRVTQAMLKNAGMVPVEVELLQEIVALKEIIRSLNDDMKKAEYMKSLEEKQLQLNILLERSKRNSKNK